MNTGKRYSKIMFLALLLAAFVAGCGHDDDNNNEAASSAKAITAYSIAGQVSSAITGTAIAVTMPYGTPSVTALVATFSISGTSLTVGTSPVVTQESGTTPNDFTNPVLYTVHAADGSTANYTVTVTVGLSSAKAITAYSIASQVSSTIIASSITVTMPYSTPSVTNLVATFSTTGASVSVGTSPVVTQESGTTPNDFTNPVVYTVHAADGSTATYTVTVHVAAAISTVDLGTAGNFVILTKTGIGNVPTSAITGNIGVSTTTGASILVTCAEMSLGSEMFTDDATPVDTCVSSDKTAAGLAVADMETAYTNAAAQGPGVGAFLNVGAGTVTAQTLPPGVYTWDGDVSITGDLTLNGTATDVWIFQIAGTLGTDKQIILAGAAKARNVFWVVAGAVTFQGTTQFTGIILAKTNIAMITGATINGRLLAQTRVDLDANTVTQPTP